MTKEKKPEKTWKWTPPKAGQKIKIIDKEPEYKPPKTDKKGKK